MRGSARLGVFAAALCVAFGVAFAAGAVVDPVSSAGQAETQAHEALELPPMVAQPASPPTVAGLSASDSGYTLQVADGTLPTGRQVLVSFRIAGPDGAPVQQYRLTHEKELHLMLVRRDLSSLQHLHPTRDVGGTWTTTADLSAAGTYRMIADFALTAVPDRSFALGTDVSVPGTFEAAEMPAPGPVSSIDDYEVGLAAAPRAGEEADLVFTISRAGAPVTDLKPEPPTGDHLVALRSGDLAYLHTHPTGSSEMAGPTLRFETTFPTAGAYRLFLSFTHAGQLRTASFTVDVVGPPSGAPSKANGGPRAEPVAPAATGSGGHGGHG